MKIYFLSILLVCISLFSCKNASNAMDSKAGIPKEGDLQIVASYIQTEFAGDQQEENKSWLTIIMEKDGFRELVIDSIHFSTKTYELSEEFQGFLLNNNQVRLLLNKNFKSEKVKQFSSILYYHRGESNFLQNILSIEIKEPIYLP